MNKKILFLIFCFCIIFCIVFSVSSDNGRFSWCTDPKTNGQRPQKFEAKELTDKYKSIYLGNENEKNIYLTFDVGYENGNVEKTLDTLKGQNVKGAFFVLPHFINANPSLVERMISEGHLVCNHSYSHKDMSKISDFKEFEKEIYDLEKLYKEKTGQDMAKYFRPPEGRFSENTLSFANKLGYKTVFWSIAYADWDNNRQIAPEKAKDLIVSRIHNGAVILLHPTSETNAKMLNGLILELKEKGYSFLTLDEFR